MNTHFFQNFAKNHKIFLALRFFFLFLLTFLLLFATACKQTIDYAEYVTEERANILLYSGENFHVAVHDVKKEYPYLADGYVGERTQRVEIFISAPQGTTHCQVQFFLNGKTHGGEASFDSVKREYYYSCNESVASLYRLPIRLQFGDSSHEVTAVSVRTDDTISTKKALLSVTNEASELFAAMTSRNVFLGELYVRLLYEDAPYYYVGVVDRSGNITAFLLDAETGKVLARRDP